MDLKCYLLEYILLYLRYCYVRLEPQFLNYYIVYPARVRSSNLGLGN